MKIIMPMAGLGNRFSSKGISTPKPLIEISGMYMLEWALKSVNNLPYSELIFIILKDHDIRFNLSSELKKLKINNSKIIIINEVTEGQLSSVLAASEQIDSHEDILILSSDTYVISNIGEQLRNKYEDCKGTISVIKAEGTQWSFVKTNKENRAVRVAEKERISPLASTGMYYFSSGREFLVHANEIIFEKEKSKGEYYIIPVYQKYIDAGSVININLANEMWDLGTPASIQHFIDNFQSTDPKLL